MAALDRGDLGLLALLDLLAASDMVNHRSTDQAWS